MVLLVCLASAEGTEWGPWDRAGKGRLLLRASPIHLFSYIGIEGGCPSRRMSEVLSNGDLSEPVFEALGTAHLSATEVFLKR